MSLPVPRPPNNRMRLTALRAAADAEDVRPEHPGGVLFMADIPMADIPEPGPRNEQHAFLIKGRSAICHMSPSRNLAMTSMLSVSRSTLHICHMSPSRNLAMTSMLSVSRSTPYVICPRAGTSH